MIIGGGRVTLVATGGIYGAGVDENGGKYGGAVVDCSTRCGLVGLV